MKTTRRSFIGALAAFVFGVRAEIFRESIPLAPAIPSSPSITYVATLDYIHDGAEIRRYTWTESNQECGVEFESPSDDTQDFVANHIHQQDENTAVVFFNA